MPPYGLRPRPVNVDVPRRVQKVQPLRQLQQKKISLFKRLQQLPIELRWKILGMTESRPESRLVSRDWSRMVSTFWNESGEIFLPISEVVLHMRFTEKEVYPEYLWITVDPSLAGCLRQLMAPLVNKRKDVENIEGQVSFKLYEEDSINQVLRVLKHCPIESATVAWWREKSYPTRKELEEEDEEMEDEDEDEHGEANWDFLDDDESIEEDDEEMEVDEEDETMEEDEDDITSEIPIPFDALLVSADHERWRVSDVTEMLRGSPQLLIELKMDIKSRLLRLSSTVDYIRLEHRSRNIADGRFAGVRVEQWPSLAASMVSRGLPSLSLYTEDGSPFNDRIASAFIVALKPVHIESFFMTVPANAEDVHEEDEWRRCTIEAQYTWMPFKRFEIRENPDWINNFNPRLFAV